MTGATETDDEVKRRQERILSLYAEASKNAGVFVEWRHKILLLASTILALTFAIASFMIKEFLSGYATGLVLLTMSAFFVTFAYLDRRNAMLLQACYNTAAGIEEWLLGATDKVEFISQRKSVDRVVGGVFAAIDDSRQKDAKFHVEPWTYGWVLRRLYFSVAFIFIAIAIVLFVLAARGTPLVIAR